MNEKDENLLDSDYLGVQEIDPSPKIIDSARSLFVDDELKTEEPESEKQEILNKDLEITTFKLMPSIQNDSIVSDEDIFGDESSSEGESSTAEDVVGFEGRTSSPTVKIKKEKKGHFPRIEVEIASSTDSKSKKYFPLEQQIAVSGISCFQYLIRLERITSFFSIVEFGRDK